MACSGARSSRPATGPSLYRGGDASVSRAADDVMQTIAAGRYVAGSTPEEREQAYHDHFVSAGSEVARKGSWFEHEADRHVETLVAYRIDLAPVTNAAYAEFVGDTGTLPPAVDQAAWTAQGFNQDYETEVKRLNWLDGRPPAGREDHPVLLVTWAEARAYCDWRGAVVGGTRRLPNEAEYEKAARGDDGVVYPWGNTFDADKLNSRVAGPGDTTAVGTYPQGASPHGILDPAGNVFQWTATPWKARADEMTVKGSAWDDFAGVGRGASRHGRRKDIRHAIIGFRCAG